MASASASPRRDSSDADGSPTIDHAAHFETATRPSHHLNIKHLRRQVTREHVVLARDSDSEGSLPTVTRRCQRQPRLKDQRHDRQTLLRLMQSVGEGDQGWRLLANAAPELRGDRSTVMEAMKLTKGTALEVATPELHRDADLLCEALHMQAESGLWWDASKSRPAWETIIKRFMPQKGGPAAPKPAAPVAPQSARRSVTSGQSPRKSVTMRDRLESTSSPPQQVRPACTKQDSKNLSWEPDSTWDDGCHKHAEPGDSCGMMQGENGEPIRVVPVIGLRLHRSDGFLLVQLAKADATGSNLVRECLLPGRKIAPDKWPRDEIASFIEDMLAPLARAICLRREVTFTLEERESRTVGIKTRYLRAVFDATLEAGFQWERFFEEVPPAADRLLKRGVAYRRRAPLHSSGLVQRLNAGGHSHLAPDMFAIPPEHLDHPDARLTIYAWMPWWEYNWLHEPLGQAALEQWMSDLDREKVNEMAQKAIPLRTRFSSQRRGGIMAAMQELRLEPRRSVKKPEDDAAAQSALRAANTDATVRRALQRFKALGEAAIVRQEGASS